MSTAGQEIDLIIQNAEGWKGQLLSELRAAILEASPLITEAVKWKMPSKPLGSATWETAGILCVADILKAAVRLTFPNGAKLTDPNHLFNSRMDSKTVRAIDFPDGVVYDKKALQGLVLEAIVINQAKAK